MIRLILQILIMVLAVLSWEIGVRLSWLDSFFVSSPAQVIAVIYEWIRTGLVWRHLVITVSEAVVGLIVGLTTGVASGFLVAISPRIGQLLQPFLVVANALPRISLAPLIVLWFGFGFTSTTIIVWSLVFFTSFFAAHRGFNEVPLVLVKNARVLGATQYQLFEKIYFPASLAWVFSSLRTSVGFAFTGAILGEFIANSGVGVGYLIDSAQANFDSASLMSGLVVLAISVTCIDCIVELVERRLCRWQPKRN